MPKLRRTYGPLSSTTRLEDVTQEEYTQAKERYQHLRQAIAKNAATPDECTEALDLAYQLQQDDDLPRLQDAHQRAIERKRSADLEQQRHERAAQQAVQNLLAGSESIRRGFAQIIEALADANLPNLPTEQAAPQLTDAQLTSARSLDTLAIVPRSRLEQANEDSRRYAQAIEALDLAIDKKKRQAFVGIIEALDGRARQMAQAAQLDLDRIEVERARRQAEKKRDDLPAQLAQLAQRVEDLERSKPDDQ